MGADAVLLIAAILERPQSSRGSTSSPTISVMAVLVEVHDEGELEQRARHRLLELVGVNQRDLHTFEVDRRRAAGSRATSPPGVLKIAESGVESAADVAALAAAGSTRSSSVKRCFARLIAPPPSVSSWAGPSHVGEDLRHHE